MNSYGKNIKHPLLINEFANKLKTGFAICCWCSFWSESQTCESLISNFTDTVLADLCALCVIFCHWICVTGIPKNRFLKEKNSPNNTKQQKKQHFSVEYQHENIGVRHLSVHTVFQTSSNMFTNMKNDLFLLLCIFCCVCSDCFSTVSLPFYSPLQDIVQQFLIKWLLKQTCANLCTCEYNLAFLQVSNNQFFLLLLYLAIWKATPWDTFQSLQFFVSADGIGPSSNILKTNKVDSTFHALEGITLHF